MEQQIYYITMGVCVAGCLSRLLLAGYYSRLLHDLKSMKSSKNKTVQALKEQFLLRYQAMLGVNNVGHFVGRFFAERRLFGLSLGFWNGLHTQFVTVCLLLGAVSALFMVVQGEEPQAVLTAMFHGIWTSTLLLFVDGFCMIPTRRSGVQEGFCDYLENYFQVRLEHEYSVWGKQMQDAAQTKAVMEAQLLVADERSYYKQKKMERRREKEVLELERKRARIKQETAFLKQEVEERRKRVAEAAAAREQGERAAAATESGKMPTEQEQIEELLKDFLIRC